jgi:hypothetical protein
MEFNPDGSIKLPEKFAKQKQDRENRLKNSKCILIRKDIVDTRSPKKCVLRIKLSDAIYDNSFVHNVYNVFRERAEVPTKLKKLNEKGFEVEIGTCFRRCSDCNALIARFRNSINGSVIEDSGSCTFEKRKFDYEDYFD